MRYAITRYLPSILVALALAGAAGAADYYVDVQSGSDSTGDGSSESPWRTITHALGQARSPGDVVHVLPGVYDETAGEVFPLAPATGVSLVSVEGPEVTELRGRPDADVILVEAHEDCEMSGLTITGGLNGIRSPSGLRRNGVGPILVLTNNTITSNAGAGVYFGADQHVELQDNRIRLNEHGLMRKGYPLGRTGPTSLTSKRNLIEANRGHGVRFDNAVSARSTHDVIRDNGGVGWWQKNELFAGFQTILINGTISGNAGGGLYTFADQYCWYDYYFGWQCLDPSATIGASATTVYGNGGFGGAKAAGTSPGSFGSLNDSIAWGNQPVDNVNFFANHSDIGTGQTSGSNNISADPRFVDGPGGDFRLRHDSPCVDLAFPSAPNDDVDFEGEPRMADGDSDGEARRDMGADELHPLVAPVGPAGQGQPFAFEALAPPAHDGQLALVLLSQSRSSSGGLPLPGAPSLKVDLEPDALFSLGITFLPLFQTTLAAGQGQTTSFILPPNAFGPEIFYAGVLFDLAAGKYQGVTPTHSFIQQ